MNRVRKLEACKAAYDAMQAQLHFVELHGSVVCQMHDTVSILSESKAAAERALDVARQNYKESVPSAMAALYGLDGRVYDVLFRYYVLGCTTRTIAMQRGESHRTVTKAKARGLQILAALEFEKEDAHE